ncbi:unnamed protein product [Polarella glacialis]|uniref:Uncharacterized protein n=1 Tax=Polarella glacialis TaxID=89957 RepID=A0A813DYB3_POLGL|nr:unnamed protein product [Polarella glacialis]
MEQMLARKKPAPSVGGGPARKVRVCEQKSEPSKLELATAKLVAITAGKVRQHDACLLRTIILPTQRSVALAMDAAGKEYFLEKQRTKVQSALPPHLHAWCAAILAASSLKEISDEDRWV